MDHELFMLIPARKEHGGAVALQLSKLGSNQRGKVKILGKMVNEPKDCLCLNKQIREPAAILYN